MGQQQLLLIILVTIIVGIATVIAINVFTSAAESAKIDAIRQDLVSIGASSQGYFRKPTMLGGGGNAFTGITFHRIAFGGNVASDTEGNNENGTYSIESIDTGDFIVTATANVPDSTEIQARICPDDIIMGTPDGGAPGACP